MRHAPQRPDYTEAQRREASDWFAVLHGAADPSAESLQAWLRWIEQSEGNRAAFDAVTQAWHATPPASVQHMPSADELLDDEYDGSVPIDEWLRRSQPKGEVRPQAKMSDPAPLWRRPWLAAAAMVLVVVASLAVHRYSGERGLQSGEFTTRTAERIEITLADGSHVWLGPKSRLLVNFSEQRRSIHLTTGEAFFAVTKDAQRPFAVASVGGEIVAVGTAFNVRALDGQVTVAVSEGLVAVIPGASSTAPAAGAGVHVASGQQLTFQALQPIKALTIVESPTPGERGRWRDGVLVYRNESLRDVIRDVVRYSDIQIEIADSAVGDMRFSGVIRDGAVREWISALPESFPVTVVSDGSREIIKAR